MTRIKKELNKVKVTTYSKRNKDAISQAVDTLLLEAHSEDRKILEEAGLDVSLNYRDSLREEENRTKHTSKLYNRDSYTGSQVKDLCLKYDLCCLRTEYYKGTIPPDIARKVKEFHELNDLTINKFNLYILAPREAFDRIDSDTDPILFYKIPGNKSSHEYEVREKDTLVAIHDWGNDFSYFRRFRYLFYRERMSRDPGNIVWTISSITFLFVALVTALSSGAFWIVVTLLILGIFPMIGVTKRRINRYWNEY